MKKKKQSDEERMKAFFKMLHDAGITEALVVHPPPDADGVKADIQPDGSLTMKNKTTGESLEIIEKSFKS